VLNKNVVCSIPCECSKSTIGETRHVFDVRMKYHKNSIKKKDPYISKLCEQHFNTRQRILWDQAEIVVHEQRWNARKVHGAAEIMKNSVSVNLVW
jgi:hypothetical protein